MVEIAEGGGAEGEGAEGEGAEGEAAGVPAGGVDGGVGCGRNWDVTKFGFACSVLRLQCFVLVVAVRFVGTTGLW